ncbi:glutathione S-transferase [Annulohypoxylon stygium]|nr:glutathione S-transferase [Annulohypoxylon stygium]
MSSPTKPIRLWLTPAGPNPWKVPLILEELSVPYEIECIKFDDVKKRPYTNINPNGRVPAIIQYIVEQYDVNKVLTYDTLKERHHLNQWLQFQMSGQGPYYGVAAWFNVLHHEKLPSAIERYNDQLKRVLGVLNGWLEHRQWLVGDKMTYADLAFVPWNDRIDSVILCKPEDKFAGFPHVQAWHERMILRPSWKKVMEIREPLMKSQGLQNATGRPARFKTHQEFEAAVARGESTDPQAIYFHHGLSLRS